ncbi:MATE family efflux transporter [Harryflintia acetispora]|uniref:Multidrug export protein MepA n=1 Tax=Harryflintia acetispora TaxID=1849041 RepID=A0A9X8Y798_9FIRM|nr:MATE family efflux transporter [Harryflintia acetispora]TCL41532.1 putative MATE family efflux protein [Harryflintia acetispora]
MYDPADLIQESVGKLFSRYLFPSICATIMISINFFVDTLCIGRAMGEGGLAALNLSLPVTSLLYAVGSLLGVGGSTRYSAAMGRGEIDEAQKIYTLSTLLCLSVSLLLMALGVLFLPQLVTFMGGTGGSRQGVTDYLRYVVWFIPVFTGEMFYNIFVRNDRSPRYAMFCTLCGSSTNILLDVLFIFVFDWGMAGASLATSLSICISLGLLLCYTRRSECLLRLQKISLRLSEICQILRVGFSNFLLEITTGVVTFVFNMVLLRLAGENGVAAYGIVANLTIVVTATLNGVSNAMQPIVSANAGAGLGGRVARTVRLAIFCALGFGLLFALAGEVFSVPLVRTFVSAEGGFLAMSARAVRIIFLSYLPAGVNIVLTVYLQSIQAAKEAITLSLLKGVVLPSVMVMLCGFLFGLTGVWVSTILSEGAILLCALLLCRGAGQKFAAYQPVE